MAKRISFEDFLAAVTLEAMSVVVDYLAGEISEETRQKTADTINEVMYGRAPRQIIVQQAKTVHDLKEGVDYMVKD